MDKACSYYNFFNCSNANSKNLDLERTTINVADDEKVFVREETLSSVVTIRYQYDNHLGSACLELNDDGSIISYEEYHPFGTTSYRSGRNETEVSLKRYKYCSKERDEETGLYYYGARYYVAWLGRFVSVDPLQNEQLNKTPYHYCSNNPISRIDPYGMADDLYIRGVESKRAFAQLQSSTSLKLQRDETTGKISASGKAKTKDDQTLLNAINDQTINVNIEAINNNEFVHEGNTIIFTGGAFMGNEVTVNVIELEIGIKPFKMLDLSFNSIEAYQVVNPDVLSKIDAATQMPGKSMLHEVTESYEGALISQDSGISAKSAISGKENFIYDLAHQRASIQPGENKFISKLELNENGRLQENLYLRNFDNKDIFIITKPSPYGKIK